MLSLLNMFFTIIDLWNLYFIFDSLTPDEQIQGHDI